MQFSEGTTYSRTFERPFAPSKSSISKKLRWTIKRIFLDPLFRKQWSPRFHSGGGGGGGGREAGAPRPRVTGGRAESAVTCVCEAGDPLVVTLLLAGFTYESVVSRPRDRNE